MMNKKLLLLSATALLAAGSVVAQTKIGSNPATITAGALLQLDTTATGKALLLPRVGLTSTTAAAPLPAHAAGMSVYNTATTGDVTPGFYYNNGTAWQRIASTTELVLRQVAVTNTTPGVTGQVVYNTNTTNGLPAGPVYYNGTQYVSFSGNPLPNVALTSTTDATTYAPTTAGTQVFNTSTTNGLKQGQYTYNGSKWVSNDGGVIENVALTSTSAPAGTVLGQTIYNTNAGSGVPVGQVYWNGTSWTPVTTPPSVALTSATAPAGTTVGQTIYNTNAGSGLPVGPAYWNGTRYVPQTPGNIRSFTNTTTAINATPAPAAGDLIYDQSCGCLKYYNGTAFVDPTNNLSSFANVAAADAALGSTRIAGDQIFDLSCNCVRYYDGTSWNRVAVASNGGTVDTTNDAWVNNTAATRVELGATSTGAARAIGSEVVINDNGTVGVGLGAGTATNRLHVKAPANPLRVEGLVVGNGDEKVLIADSNGVVRTSILSVSAYDYTNDAWINNPGKTRMELGTSSTGGNRPPRSNFVIQDNGDVTIGDVDVTDTRFSVVDTNTTNLVAVGATKYNTNRDMYGMASVIEQTLTNNTSRIAFATSGVASTVVNSGVNNPGTLWGGAFNAYRGGISTDPGTFGNIIGINTRYGHFTNSTTTTTTGRVAGLYLEPKAVRGTITNMYDIQIANTLPTDAATVTNRWSVYNASTAPSFSAGRLGIGVGNTNPATITNKLHVVDAANPLRLEGLQNGAATDNILTVDANGVVKTTTVAIGKLNAVDTTNDAWVNNTAATRVELSTTSTGAARTAGSEFVVNDNGSVGIGVTGTTTGKVTVAETGSYAQGLLVTNTATNKSFIVGISTTAAPTITNSTAFTAIGSYAIATPNIAAGTTNPGFAYGSVDVGIRGAGGADAGTLNALWGNQIQYGHTMGSNSSTTTNFAYGLSVLPFANAGVINKMYDVFIGGLPTNSNATINDHFSIYNFSNSRSYFRAAIGINKENPGSNLAVVGLPVFADNAAAKAGANGLTSGDFYRTADGTVKVVY